MKIREITPDDLPALVALLTEGFPRKTPAYWQNALDILATRPKVGDLPQFGLTVEHDGVLHGVMLLIAQDTERGPMCNLSSWYMRPDMRKYAALLFQRSLRWKGVSYTDCSPADHVLPIVEKFGFTPYTGGTVLLDARAALRPGPAVRALKTATALEDLSAAQRAQVARALSYGCRGFMLKDASGAPVPVLYRTTKLKGLVPAARFVLGDPRLLISHAPGLMRALFARAIPVMLIDWLPDDAPTTGKVLPHYGLRYCRGETRPEVGDLSDTEIGLFGL